MISTLAGVLILTLLQPPSPALALGATNNHLSIDVIRSADCTGEDVEISGMIHLRSQSQADGSEVIHFNYQNVRGLGLTSGTIYQVSGVDQARLSAGLGFVPYHGQCPR